LVNEFGEVGIDGDLLRSCGFCPEEELEGRLVELANGCLCCTVQEDFIPTMETLLQRADQLDGIVVDDSAAVFTGKWERTGLAPNVGGGAFFAGRQAAATARYEFKVPASGKYEVRVYWAGHENRASNAPCLLEREGQPVVETKLDQRQTASNGANVLGVFDFTKGATNAVVLRTAGADGNVVADAVQLVTIP
jgi:hypothetical protein